MNLPGEKMTLTNQLDNLRIAILTDGREDGGRAEADLGSVDTPIEMQYLSTRPTLNMTATWGN